jgi:SAM-dependent methyltransferase
MPAIAVQQAVGWRWRGPRARDPEADPASAERSSVDDQSRREGRAAMKPCNSHDGDPLAVLARWYKTPLGRQVARAENACLERLLQDCFGLYLLQFGAPGQFHTAFDLCRIRQRIVLGETLPDAGNDDQTALIRALPFELPLASASVDAVVLPHTLDFCVEAHQVLREVERVLIPEGRLVLFCFNPLSTWGLMRWLPRRRRRVPWCGGQMTPFRIGDWLRLLGFQLETRDMLLFRPPMGRPDMPQLDWLDSVGGRWWPMLGGVYGIRAVKRVTALTPIRPSWRQHRQLLPGRAVEPTTRDNGRA